MVYMFVYIPCDLLEWCQHYQHVRAEETHCRCVGMGQTQCRVGGQNNMNT